jgi:two-component system, NarL family, sensor histidine kinase DesK
VARISGSKSPAAGVERVDRATRWQLYVLSATEPFVVLLLLSSQATMRAWPAAVLLMLAVAHAAACLALLRAGLSHLYGGRRPSVRLVALAVAITAAGLVTSVATFPAEGSADDGSFDLGFAAGAAMLLFCCALTGAAAPLLSARHLAAVVGTTAVAVELLQLAGGGGGNPLWVVNYVLSVGTIAVVYRSGVWFLGVLWELERGRDAQARLAVAEERLRFARDLHDVLGRNLTLIAVNSELAAHQVRSQPDEAAEIILEVRETAHESMREMRELVAGRRVTDLDSELAGARSVLRSAGISVRVIGDGAGLSGEAQAGFGWVVREATTNMIRHSEPSAATIELGFDDDAVVGRSVLLRIENDGARPRGADARDGTGLTGLRERLAPLGGDLRAEALPGGRFLVRARLPLTHSPGIEPAGERVP